ncbi:uncharacterized protein MELLADRAFT_33922 [Melampsora larici-populina 98AG31]|uniref:RRM domain-containing protein n=1 Tax=Melampsora larici-populina (strain 98AG31 / pathotype 3-4-7) TaxID=747676 RepID=F4RB63_MELLP|nr:uncharacterized protein MELLADRAFT_33922 [Melampsora larici-populina 98AG31]EGG10024.1 hypothetical protein MELLADRAFT_33922 [Melampsora larici-populina 98AG31]
MSDSSDCTIQVSGLGPSTTEESLDQFFSFCGKIKSITRHEKTATIVFEKASAAKTSLMLNGGTLDSTTITVTGTESATSAEDSSPNPVRPVSAEGDEVKQEDKPRSAIAAEYLAHGYVLGDQAIAKAIALDQQHGISNKFLDYFKKIDTKFKVSQKSTQASAQVTTKAQAVNNQTGATNKLGSLFSMGRQYYEKALSSSQGSKVREFYTKTSKQVLDVHAEAKRIAEEKAGHPVFEPLKKSNQPKTTTSTSEEVPGYDLSDEVVNDNQTDVKK